MKAYDGLKTGLQVATAVFLGYALGGCQQKEIKDATNLARTSAKQIKKVSKDGKLNIEELSAIGTAYLRIDKEIRAGATDKDIIKMRDLYKKVIDSFFTGNGKFKVWGYASGLTPTDQERNIDKVETDLDEKVFDTAVGKNYGREGTTTAKTAYEKTRIRANFLSRIQKEAKNIMNLANNDVDNKAWDSWYVEVPKDVWNALIRHQKGFERWSLAVHDRYNDGKKENHEYIRTAFGLTQEGKEDYKLPEAQKKAVDALKVPEKKKEEKKKDKEDKDIIKINGKKFKIVRGSDGKPKFDKAGKPILEVVK